MDDELNNSEDGANKLKLAKTNSLERELNSTLTKAVHEKYGSEADLDEIARKRKRNIIIKFFLLVFVALMILLSLLIWIKKGNFEGKDPDMYKDLVTAISNFTLKPNDDDNLQNMAKVLAKLSATFNGSDNDILATGYAVFAVQEIKAGYIDLGIADSKKIIANFPESPCTENLNKILTGITCNDCQGSGTNLETCDLCHGNGRCTKCNGRKVLETLSGQEIRCNQCSGTGKCPRCLGKGKIEKKCRACKGTGHVFDEVIFGREAAKIMTKALSASTYLHTKAEVIDYLNKTKKRINEK